MRAILIDPTIEGGLVTEGDFDIERGDVRSLYKILGVDNIERAGPLPNNDMVYVDGYGLLKPAPRFFSLIEGWHEPLAGRGLLLSDTRGGYLASPRTSLAQAQAAVSFPAIELVGFEPFDEIVRTPDGGNLYVMGSHAVFRQKQ